MICDGNTLHNRNRQDFFRNIANDTNDIDTKDFTIAIKVTFKYGKLSSHDRQRVFLD